MDYVKLKPKGDNKSGYGKIILFAMSFIFGFASAYLYQSLHHTKHKTNTVKHLPTKIGPKLRFYDVLVNEQKYSQLALPFVLEAGIYEDEANCAKLVEKLNQFGEHIKIKHFTQNDVNMCQVMLGPYENLNAVYKVKAKFYEHGYVLALRDNYPEEK